MIVKGGAPAAGTTSKATPSGWPHGYMNRAPAAYATARDQAEQHNVAGEPATRQAQRAFVATFTDPDPR